MWLSGFIVDGGVSGWAKVDDMLRATIHIHVSVLVCLWAFV